MADINAAIEHLHAARQLLPVAEFAISRAESQIATTEIGDRLEDELYKIKALAQLCKETNAMLSEALNDTQSQRVIS